MHSSTPAESVHALDLEELKAPNITFWSAWQDKELLGCGALKELNGGKRGEIKSMRTVRAHLRKGVASTLLNHIIVEAKQRSYNQLLLETGSQRDIHRRSKQCIHGVENLGPWLGPKRINIE